MANSNKSKRTRSYIALLLVLALLFAIDYFMGDPAGVMAPLETVESSPAPQTPASSSDAVRGTVEVYLLDVGQGDSIFLKSPSGKTMLIDASTSDMAEKIDEFLQKQNVTRLDVVIGTHPHADHIGGMRKIISKYDVGVYYMPDAVNNTSMFEKLVDELDARNIPVEKAVGGADSFIDWDDKVEVRFFSPFPGASYEDLNNYSVVCHVRIGETSIMLTGDAEEQAEEALMKEIPATLLRSTVLKLGHHGSSSSTSEGFLNSVRPKLAVASLGADNEYGHPHQETLDKLKNADIPLLRTDLSGTIHITLDGTGYKVETER